MKIVRAILAAVVGGILFCPYKVVSSGDYEHKIVNYVALGDSIAKGYGLKSVDTESYVGRIASMLEERYGAVHVTNFGENGLRSDELLAILENREDGRHESYMEEIRKADLITLSIGSNDLLQYVSVDMDVDEFKKRGDEIFTAACLRFEENFPRIIDIIQKEAPSAQLFVNNVYNPCHDISFSISDDILKNLDEMAERYVEKMNAGFYSPRVQSVFSNKNKGKKSKRYVLVDVKGAFETSSEKLINVAFSWKNIDPHPNREGHRRIAELIIPQISLDK